MSEKVENLTEQSHKLEATYVDEHGKKKRGSFRTTAKSKTEAINKVGVALSQRNYKNIDVKHAGIDESVEVVDESKTYRADPDEKSSFANRVRNMKKKIDKEAHDRAESKRHVDEAEEDEDEASEESEDDEVNEDTVNELSKEKLSRYEHRSSSELQSRSFGFHPDSETNPEENDKKVDRRAKGHTLAYRKLGGAGKFGNKLTEPKVLATEEEILDEKDIGKKGKNFDKIENKAEKEYGSKEAGAKVAGAILAKLRKKHPIKYSAKKAKE